jgi:hypothetical protein
MRHLRQRKSEAAISQTKIPSSATAGFTTAQAPAFCCKIKDARYRKLRYLRQQRRRRSNLRREHCRHPQLQRQPQTEKSPFVSKKAARRASRIAIYAAIASPLGKPKATWLSNERTIEKIS